MKHLESNWLLIWVSVQTRAFKPNLWDYSNEIHSS